MLPAHAASPIIWRSHFFLRPLYSLYIFDETRLRFSTTHFKHFAASFDSAIFAKHTIGSFRACLLQGVYILMTLVEYPRQISLLSRYFDAELLDWLLAALRFHLPAFYHFT